VRYQHDHVFSCHLVGISLEATRELFSARKAKYTTDEIEDAYQLTDGHAFWLDLLASQIAKNDSLTVTTLLERIRQGKGHLPENTLSSIWATLKDREQLVLRSMAETVRPVSELEIADFLSRRMTYQKVIRAINALRALNLIVVKKQPSADDVLELHPLVRQFIRHKFSKPERSSFIEEIILAFKRYMWAHRDHLEERPTLSLLHYWSQTAELDIADGRISDAFDTLEDASGPFIASAYPREFSRVARSLFASIDWVSEHQKFKSFDVVFRAQSEILSYLGEYAEADQLLDRYEMTVVDRNVRYIRYCEMKCYANWVRGQFTDAVRWGKIGLNLKTSSSVDTDIDPSHSLALAERDAGQPESALPVFLAGQTLAEATDPEELDYERSGPHYGNTGRCLHFMGQVDGALVCYQKSALLLEKAPTTHVTNQGFIRRWIGELLMARKQYRLAAIFLEAARLKWEQVAPPRAKDIGILQSQLERESPGATSLTDVNVEQICRDWILGRHMDAAV
jgi:tetratricopeptide (TPR) repeat protein